MTRSRKITLVLIGICCISLLSAFIVGISDNLPGIALCYVAAATLILAFVHTWRQVRRFLILAGASLIGFPIFVVLHNLFYALGILAAGVILLNQLLEFLHAAFFIIAIIVCPPGFLIGAVGSVIVYFKKREPQQTEKA